MSRRQQQQQQVTAGETRDDDGGDNDKSSGTPVTQKGSSLALLDDGERKMLIKAYLNDDEKIQVRRGTSMFYTVGTVVNTAFQCLGRSESNDCVSRTA